MSKNRTSRFIPVIVAVSIVAGILIGTFYANHFSGNKLGIINTSSNKLNALLRIIDDQYVDTVNMGELVEDAMPQILGELDPHSSYIPAKDLGNKRISITAKQVNVLAGFFVILLPLIAIGAGGRIYCRRRHSEYRIRVQ